MISVNLYWNEFNGNVIKSITKALKHREKKEKILNWADCTLIGSLRWKSFIYFKAFSTLQYKICDGRLHAIPNKRLRWAELFIQNKASLLYVFCTQPHSGFNLKNTYDCYSKERYEIMYQSTATDSLIKNKADFKVFSCVLWQFTMKFAPLTRVFRCAMCKLSALHLKACGYTWKLAYSVSYFW